MIKAVDADLMDQAWNNKGSAVWAVSCWFLGPAWVTTVGFPTRPDLFGAKGARGPHLLGINGGCRGDTYSLVRGEILRPREDELLRRHFPRMPPSIKNESVGIEDDQIPS